MKDRKTRLNLFPFYDKNGIERYLAKQAAEGWMVDSVSSLTFGFHRIKPAKMKFSVAFFAKASLFDEEPTEEQLAFEDVCLQTGWDSAVSNRQMPIYFNNDENAEPIPMDPVLEVKSIHGVAQKGYLLSYYLLLMLSMFWLAIFVRDLFANPVKNLLSNTQLLSFLMFIFIWGGILFGLHRYYEWYHTAKKIAAEENRFLPAKGYSKRSIQVFIITCLILVALQLTSAFDDYRVALVTAFFIFVQFLLIYSAFRGASKIKNLVFEKWQYYLYYMGSLVISYIGLSILLWVSLAVIFIPAITGRKPQGTYKGENVTYQVYLDELPLKVEDMIPISYEGYSYQITDHTNSVFLSQIDADQSPQTDALYEPGIRYTVTTVRFGFLYNIVKQNLLEDFKNYFDDDLPKECLRIDETAWGAKEAYRLRYDGTLMQRFFLCYDTCFVEISFSGNAFTFSEEETAVVGQKLGH